MDIWAIADPKGDIGKTTKRMSLAELPTTRGKQTSLIDLEPPRLDGRVLELRAR